MILRRESSECLDLSNESDLDIWLATRSFDLSFHYFAFFKHYFQCKNRSLKRVSYLLILVIQENKIFISLICNPLYFSFVNHARHLLFNPLPDHNVHNWLPKQWTDHLDLNKGSQITEYQYLYNINSFESY